MAAYGLAFVDLICLPKTKQSKTTTLDAICVIDLLSNL